MSREKNTSDNKPGMEPGNLDNHALRQLTTLQLMLTGESLVDATHLWFSDRDGADQFLRLCQFDTDNPLDLARLRELHRFAIDYLAEVHKYRMPASVEQADDVRDLFVLASSKQHRDAQFACMILKTMHVLHHVAGHELLFSHAIPEAQLFDRLSTRAFTVIDRMRASGIEILGFSGGKKSRSSTITKLLAKRATLASQLFDKARFSVVVKDRKDLVPALLFLSENLFPVSYVVPEQSQNGLLTLGDIAASLSLKPAEVWKFWKQGHVPAEVDGEHPTPRNEFSGPNYRCINFVVDIPMRIDDLAPSDAPAIAFALAEIQVVDEATEKANNQGENAHTRYKKRQVQRVQMRLEGKWGEES